LALYRPWSFAPFDVTDFPEFVPLLKDADTVLGRLQLVIGYFRDHGRSNILTSALLVANWELFGVSAAGWRWSQAFVMALLVFVVVRFLVRLEYRPVAVLAGAGLFVIGPTAVESWMRLTGEPVAAIFFLLTLGFTISRGRDLEGRAPLIVALGCGFMVLAKEVMVALVPIVLIVGLAWVPSSGVGVLRVSPRGRRLLLQAAGVLAPIGLFMFLGMAGAEGSAYSRSYVPEQYLWLKWLIDLILIMLPFADVNQPITVSTGVFFGLLCLGLIGVAMGPPSRKRRGYSVLILMLSIVLAGATIYSPWPRMERFYALPFLVGTAGLLAAGVDYLGSRGALSQLASWALVLMLMALPAAAGWGQANETRATRRVNHRLSATLVQQSPRSVVFGVRHLSDMAWQGRGPAVTRYAQALLGWNAEPLAVDEVCELFTERWADPEDRVLLAAYEGSCGALPTPDLKIVETFDVFDQSRWRFVEEEVSVLVRWSPRE